VTDQVLPGATAGDGVADERTPAVAPAPLDPVLTGDREAPVVAPAHPDSSPTEGTLRQLLRRRAPLRFAVGFAFGLLGVFAVGAGGLYAFDQQYAGRILPGVHVGDVDLSGLTLSQAAARLAQGYATLGDGTLVLTGADLSINVPLGDLRRPDVELMAKAAMAVGREGSPFDRIVGNAKTAARGVALEPQVTVDASAVELAVSSFASSIDRAPVDAKVELTKDGFQLVEGASGRATNWRALVASAVDALRDVDAPEQVVVQAEVALIPPVVSTEEAAAALKQANLMAQDIVVADTVKSWTLPASQVRSWITFEPTGEGTYRAVPNPSGLDAQLNEMAAAIQRPPTNAAYLFDRNGNIVGASEGKDGRSLDSTATVSALTALLVGRGEGQAAPSMAPVVNIVKPEITTEQATSTAPLMKKVSEWTTYFPISERNGFGANIWIPAMDIDGYVLAPGAVFDFWKAIGPVTRERGYRDGGAIINGKTEPQGALAGGICSTSTTLFNAAMRAGLPMLARRNHYYYITRYPKGLDATVFQSSSGSVQTMSFRNDTGNPILIRAYKIKQGNSGYVKFELYGVPTGRTVTIGGEVVKNVRKAIDTVQYTDAKPVGYKERLESPADGMDVWRTVEVKDAQGNVIRSTTYYSHYSRVDGVTLIGTGGSSPPAATTPDTTAPQTTAPAA
jgi:vancomycin resistance protein YoaR